MAEAREAIPGTESQNDDNKVGKRQSHNTKQTHIKHPSRLYAAGFVLLGADGAGAAGWVSPVVVLAESVSRNRSGPEKLMPL